MASERSAHPTRTSVEPPIFSGLSRLTEGTASFLAELFRDRWPIELTGGQAWEFREATPTFGAFIRSEMLPKGRLQFLEPRWLTVDAVIATHDSCRNDLSPFGIAKANDDGVLDFRLI